MKPLDPTNAYRPDLPASWWAFFGGLFLGEGCIQVSAKFGVTLSIEMCDYAVVKSVHQALGGRLVRCGIRRKAKQRQRPYKWVVSDRKLIYRIVREMLPYLRGKKAKQAHALRDFMMVHTLHRANREKQRRACYTAVEKLALVQRARRVRDFAGGGNKGWKRKWTAWERELEQEIASDRSAAHLADDRTLAAV